MRQITATRHSGKLLHHYDMSPLLYCCCDKLLALILSLWYVTRIQTSLILCNRLQRQNSVAETKIFRCHNKRFVVATCRIVRRGLYKLLYIPKTTTITYRDRSFAAIAPKLWNQLPLAIRQSDSVDSFKRALKMYLFRESSLFWVVKSIETFYM